MKEGRRGGRGRMEWEGREGGRGGEEPFLDQGIDKVLYIPWRMQLLSNTSRTNVPGMFYWVEVWRTGWPVHHTDNLVIKEGRGHPCCWGICIILH